jgi:hypothetical protein
MSHQQTIRRGEIYLGGFLGWDSSEELDVTLVYWDEGEQPVIEDGQVVAQEPAATNQEVVETSVTLSGGYDEQAIELQESFDGPRQTSLIVEGPEGSAQWQFVTHTSRTAEPLAIDTRGQLALYAGGFLIVTIGITLGLMWLARRWHQRAGAGPGYPLWIYGAAAMPIGMMSLLLGYRRILETVAQAPWILVPIVALVATVAAIHWWGDDTRRVGLVHLDIKEPHVNEDGSGSFDIRVEPFDLAEVDGKEGVVLPGISNYLARTRGTIPVVDLGDEDPSVEFNGHGMFDSVYFLDPFVDDPIEFESEGWSLSHIYRPPPEDMRYADEGVIDQLVRVIGSVAWSSIFAGIGIVWVGYVLGSLLVASGFVGAAVALIPAAMYVARPVPGRCHWNLAPGMFGEVIAEMIQAGETLSEQADLEWYREQYYSERGKNVSASKRARESDEVSRFEKIMDELDQSEISEEDSQVVADD